jgi:5-methylcytosine-specific restriction enzyme subunit McrC
MQEETQKGVNLKPRDTAHLKEKWGEEVKISSRGESTLLKFEKKAGIIGLPSGQVLAIEPKIDTNLLYLLAYTDRIDEQVIADATDAGYQAGDSLIEFLGQLFLRELERVIQRGLAQEFRDTEETQRHHRGQLQLAKQFQRQGPVPLQFECRYQELTTDVALNRIVLAAIQTLVHLLPASSLRNDLIKYREMFEDKVEAPKTPLRELDRISISHLTNHYRQLILLSKVIIQEEFLQGIDRPEEPFPSLVFDMPSVFEDAVVSAVKKSIDTTRFRVTSNDLGVLVDSVDSNESRSLEPDFIIRRKTGQAPSTEPVVAVGDAKWKKPSSKAPSRNNLYQLATYQAKFGTPGILVYPSSDTDVEKRYQYDNSVGSDAERGELIVTQLSLSAKESYGEYTRNLENSIHGTVHQLTLDNI